MQNSFVVLVVGVVLTLFGGALVTYSVMHAQQNRVQLGRYQPMKVWEDFDCILDTSSGIAYVFVDPGTIGWIDFVNRKVDFFPEDKEDTIKAPKEAPSTKAPAVK